MTRRAPVPGGGRAPAPSGAGVASPRAPEPPPSAVDVPELAAEPTAGAVIQRAVALSVSRLFEHQPGVLTGVDPEAVHQARVATRRLRSDLGTFAPLLDREWSRSLRERLRELAAELGAVRDSEVLMERLRRVATTLPERDAGHLAALMRVLASQRDRARTPLLRTLRSAGHRRLLADLVSAARSPLLLEEADGAAVEVLPGLARRPWRGLRRAVDELGPAPADEALHAVRIDAKRARYAAEAVAPAVGPPARAFASAVAGLQGVLGDHHDAVGAAEWLREQAQTLPAPAAFVAGEVAGRQRAEASRLAGEWQAAWAAAARPSLRRWLR